MSILKYYHVIDIILIIKIIHKFIEVMIKCLAKIMAVLLVFITKVYLQLTLLSRRLITMIYKYKTMVLITKCVVLFIYFMIIW